MSDYLNLPVDDPLERKGIRSFFFTYFGADWHDDQGSIEEAADEYLALSSDDPGGALLLSEVEDLIGRDFSEQDLRQLIAVRWRCDGSISNYGSYKALLPALRDYLRRRAVA